MYLVIEWLNKMLVKVIVDHELYKMQGYFYKIVLAYIYLFRCENSSYMMVK